MFHFLGIGKKKNVINGSAEANGVLSMAIKGRLFGEIDSALLEE